MSRHNKVSAILDQLVVAIAAGFVEEFKDSADDAQERARLAIARIQSQVGGTDLYIAKGHLWHIGEKHRRIYHRFTGNNHAQLAREFDLTERQIYNIVEAVARQEFDRKQCKLFVEDDAGDE